MNSLTKSWLTPVFALDRLNSWLRAEDPLFCPARSALAPVIYWTKTQAILEVSKRQYIGLRRVMVRKPCRVCDGTGTWLSDRAWNHCCWDDVSTEDARANYGEPCRTCEATGTVTLKFVESTIGPVRWHTPSEKWWSSSLDVYLPFPSYHHEAKAFSAFQYYQLADGWQPNQPGRPLSLEDALRDMLIVLETWPHEVCFAIDFHHHTKLEGKWRIPDHDAAARWLQSLFGRVAVRRERQAA